MSGQQRRRSRVYRYIDPRRKRAMAAAQTHRWFTLEGVLLIILGVLAIALPIAAGLAAALVIGWVLLLSGILGLVAVFRARHLAHPGWSAASAVIALLAGLLILWNPFAGAITLAVLLGAYFLVDGIVLIGLSLDQRRRSSRWSWMLGSGILDLILAVIILLLP